MTRTDRRRFLVLFAAIAALLALILASLYFPFVAQAQTNDATLSSLTVTGARCAPRSHPAQRSTGSPSQTVRGWSRSPQRRPKAARR